MNHQLKTEKIRPICENSTTPDPNTVIETIFKTHRKAWNAEKSQYHKTKTARRFQAALKDLMSKDWLHNYCILAGYEPISGPGHFGELAKTAASTCGCHQFDRFAKKKSLLKKIRTERKSYRYHTMRKTIDRIMRLENHRDDSDVLLKYPKPY
ncbi:unnamed protein product, partial [Nesidiocoris tenuis]